MNSETGLGPGGRYQLDDCANVGERPTPPVEGDEAEEAVLDLVPLRRAGWIVTDRDAQARLGGEPDQVEHECPHPWSVGSAGVGGDQQGGGLGEAGPAHLVPPVADRFDGELRGVCGVADRDPALVVADVVDPIGDGLSDNDRRA